MIIISGALPRLCGTGKVVAQLIEDAEVLQSPELRIIYKRRQKSLREAIKGVNLKGLFSELLARMTESADKVWRLSDEAVLKDKNMIIIHPQSLSFKFCIKLIEKRTFPTWIALFDSHYFCTRSYNYIPGESDSCIRCLTGNWNQRDEYQCPSSPPGNGPYDLEYRKKILYWASIGKVKFVVIDKLQETLVRRHFGMQAVIKKLGLWSCDWDEVESKQRKDENKNVRYDIAFHGSLFHAKGVFWAIEVAAHCPDLTFLFPFSEAAVATHLNTNELPPNCTFIPMLWESGLEEVVTTAKCVLTPSLWSAPLEGALIKSIFKAHAVATTDEPTAYASSLPDGLVLKLPRSDIKKAAEILSQAIKQQWRPDRQLYHAWVSEFRRNNRNYLSRLISMCSEAFISSNT